MMIRKRLLDHSGFYAEFTEFNCLSFVEPCLLYELLALIGKVALVDCLSGRRLLRYIQMLTC